MFGFIPVGKRFSTAIGVDLGTGNTLVHLRGKGIVLNEPSVVAVSTEDRTVRAVGLEAKRMLGRTPASVEAVRPIRDGVIAEVSLVEEMLRLFLKRVIRNRLAGLRVRVVVAVPTGLTALERRAIRSSALAAGATEVHLVPEPIAAALGVGYAVDTPTGHMLVGIGGGTTEIGVVALGGLLYGASIRVGGDRIDRAIAAHVRRAYGLLIGEPTAELVKIQLGAIEEEGGDGAEGERVVEVRGRDLVSGLPTRIALRSADVREAIQEPVQQIVAGVLRALEATPPELAADIIERGITLTGGGALLAGLDRLIERHAGVPVRVAEDPLTCVVRGTARIVDDFDRFAALVA
jgi:rod shape-determining protein MreB